MIERDLIMRMIQQLTGALARVIAHRDLKEYDEAQREIDKAGDELFGARWKMLSALPPEQMVMLLGYGENFERLSLAAELLNAQSELSGHRGQTDAATPHAFNALCLYVEYFFRSRNIPTPGQQARIDRLVTLLSTYDVPLQTRKKLFLYYELAGKYMKGEDLLFEIIQDDPSFALEGKEFYERLLKKPDAELEASGLPRAEIEESLAELKTKR